MKRADGSFWASGVVLTNRGELDTPVMQLRIGWYVFGEEDLPSLVVPGGGRVQVLLPAPVLISEGMLIEVVASGSVRAWGVVEGSFCRASRLQERWLNLRRSLGGLDWAWLRALLQVAAVMLWTWLLPRR